MLACVLISALVQLSAAQQPATIEPSKKLLIGYTSESSQAEQQWEQKFRALPAPDQIRENLRRLSAFPHHVGSTYDKDNAEWMAAHFKSWGFDTNIETFDVLFPTPKERRVELLEPTRFVAKLEEPPIAIDPTSNQQAEQLPPYNAYSIDGDVTGLLVYVMVDSVAATLDAIVAAGGAIAQPIGADAPEITARFSDPAGNILGVYQQRS